MSELAEYRHPVSLRKRDGRLVAFERDKIARAIEAAGSATGKFDIAMAQALAEGIQARIRRRVVDVELVQDTVERVLMAAGHSASAPADLVDREGEGRLRRHRQAIVAVVSATDE